MILFRIAIHLLQYLATIPIHWHDTSLDWHAPSAATLEVVLWLDATAIVTEMVSLPGGFTKMKVRIPGELGPGVNELYAAAEVGEGITTSVHGLLTVEAASDSALYLPMVVR
jgi:hypothetical protein